MLKKPVLWIFLLVIVILGISVLILKSYSPNSPNSLKNLPSKVSEKLKPGSCLVLEQKYCSHGKPVEVKKEGVTYKYIGFNLPPGVPFFAPMDGNLGKAKVSEPSPVHGFASIVNDPNDPTLPSFSFYGDLGFDNMLSSNVNKGDAIGYTQDTGIKGLGDYNIVVTAERLNPTNDGFVTDEELLRTMFPLQ